MASLIAELFDYPITHKSLLKITATLSSGRAFSVSIANPDDITLSNALRLLSETIRFESVAGG